MGKNRERIRFSPRPGRRGSPGEGRTCRTRRAARWLSRLYAVKSHLAAPRGGVREHVRSEVKSRGAMREGRACCGRTHAALAPPHTLALVHEAPDVGRGARPARPPGPTHQVRLPDVPRRGRAAEDVGPYQRFRPKIPTTGPDQRFRPQVPSTDSDHRFRPQVPTTVPDRPPVCCVIRPRSRNKSRPSRCVPFRSEIARRLMREGRACRGRTRAEPVRACRLQR